MADLKYNFGVQVRPFGRVANAQVGFKINSRELERSLRNADGTFGGPLQFEFARIHEEMARSVAERMQDVLVERITQGAAESAYRDTDRPRSPGLSGGGPSAKRLAGRSFGMVPKTNSERLKTILIQDGNLRYDSRTFATGIEEHLNASPAARYWKLLEDGGANPAVRFNFSKGKGPRYAKAGIRMASPTIPAYRYLAEGARRGRAYVKRHIGELYVDAGAAVGQKISLRKGAF